MKKSEIIVGHVYTNTAISHVRREVIGAGPEYQLYPGQAEKDCVRYRLLSKGKTGTGATLVGEEYNTTRSAFASWAKSDITEEK